MEQQEWLRRFRLRIMQRAALTEAEAQPHVDCVSFEEHSAGFEDDPEGAADEEMSYWEP